MHKTTMHRDVFYMRQALECARRAAETGEVPVGALVVSPYGEVVGTGYNRVEQDQCQSRHAEVIAIEAACASLKTWHLDRYTLYVTLEPCIMCIGLCMLSRIERIVYGADSPLFGQHISDEEAIVLSRGRIKNITAHILEEESIDLLKKFFSTKRENHGGT